MMQEGRGVKKGVKGGSPRGRGSVGLGSTGADRPSMPPVSLVPPRGQ